jgi:hypothetical protein
MLSNWNSNETLAVLDSLFVIFYWISIVNMVSRAWFDPPWTRCPKKMEIIWFLSELHSFLQLLFRLLGIVFYLQLCNWYIRSLGMLECWIWSNEFVQGLEHLGITYIVSATLSCIWTVFWPFGKVVFLSVLGGGCFYVWVLCSNESQFIFFGLFVWV